VQSHLETYPAVEDGFASGPLPSFVKQEFERFGDCCVLSRGAVLFVCEACPETKVIAPSYNSKIRCSSARRCWRTSTQAAKGASAISGRR
jgi:hypothetical protein